MATNNNINPRNIRKVSKGIVHYHDMRIVRGLQCLFDVTQLRIPDHYCAFIFSRSLTNTLNEPSHIQHPHLEYIVL